VFTEANCCKVFEASDLVLLDTQVVLGCFEVWQSQTPSNTHEFESLHSIACYSPGWLFPSCKGGEMMLHQNALQIARITKLEEQLAAITKR
jgi:hypothetical protein